MIGPFALIGFYKIRSSVIWANKHSISPLPTFHSDSFLHFLFVSREEKKHNPSENSTNPFQRRKKKSMAFGKDLNLEATELRLGLPGTSPDDQSSPINRTNSNKRALPSDDQNPPESRREINSDPTKCNQENPPPTK